MPRTIRILFIRSFVPATFWMYRAAPKPQITVTMSVAPRACRTLRPSVQKYFVDPLDDEDIAAITRIWNKLEPARG
jgi:hypothetical protein